MKTCTKCGLSKRLNSFPLRKSSPDGYRSDCKLCRSKAQHEAYVKNRATRLAVTALYFERNRAAIMQYHKEWVACNKKRVTAFQKKYDKNNPVKRLAYSRLREAIKCGQIVPPDRCTQCGQIGRIQGHHDNYAKALEVVWLCGRCHGKRTIQIHYEKNPGDIFNQEVGLDTTV